MIPNKKQATENKRVAVYCRISTDEQIRRSTEFSSLENQEEYCLKFIDLKKPEGWQYCKSYIDAGYTGANTKRPELMRLLEDAKNKMFDVVLVSKIDRLTRSIKDFYALWDVFSKSNVDIITSNQEINTTTSMGKLMINLLMSFAEFELQINSERVREKRASMAARGMYTGGHPPLGYSVVNKKLVPDIEEAVIINMMYELYNETHSQAEVAEKLNLLGYRTKKRLLNQKDNTKKEAGSQRFTSNAVTQILRNPLYIGDVQHHKEIYTGVHEPILKDRKLWFSVNESLDKKKVVTKTKELMSSNAHWLLLKGLVKCGHCQAYLTADFSGKKNKAGENFTYYTCTGIKRFGATHKCNVRSISAPELESVVIKILRSLGTDKTLLDAVLAKANKDASIKNKKLKQDEATYKQRLQVLNNKISNLVEVLSEQGASGLTGDVSAQIQVLKLDRQSVNMELQRLAIQIEENKHHITNGEVIAEALRQFDEAIDELNKAEKTALLRYLIKQIVVEVYDPKKHKSLLETSSKGFHIGTLRTKQIILKIELYDLPEITSDFINGVCQNSSSSTESIGWRTRIRT